MCSVTWLQHLNGFELFCNRDERRTRKPALAPQVWDGGVRFLAPVDGQAGGTWIGVNELGLAVCLLNGPLTLASKEGGESRGLLVSSLLHKKDVASARRALRAADLDVFQAFRLLLFETGRPPAVLFWDGAGLRQETAAESRIPLVSSSRDLKKAFERRRELLDRLVAEHGGMSPAALEAFHRSHEPEKGPWSPCMHRDDASTVSASRVVVTADRVEIHYAPGPLCEARFMEPLVLRRTPREEFARR